MPFTGGLSPSPERYGGGTPDLQRKIESIGAQIGTAYDTTTNPGIVYARAQAYARALDEMDRNNQRLANQWNAARMSEFLARWEAIYGIVPFSTDTLVSLRNRIATLQSLAGYANQQPVVDALASLLGPLYVTITTTSSATANVWTPSTWPMGSHDATGAVDWYSTIAYVLVKVVQPSGWGDNDFYTALGSIFPVLDSIMPAWVTYDWYRQSLSNGVGFWLDDTFNLDNEIFDV